MSHRSYSPVLPYYKHVSLLSWSLSRTGSCIRHVQRTARLQFTQEFRRGQIQSMFPSVKSNASAHSILLYAVSSIGFASSEEYVGYGRGGYGVVVVRVGGRIRRGERIRQIQSVCGTWVVLYARGIVFRCDGEVQHGARVQLGTLALSGVVWVCACVCVDCSCTRDLSPTLQQPDFPVVVCFSEWLIREVLLQGSGESYHHSTGKKQKTSDV